MTIMILGFSAATIWALLSSTAYRIVERRCIVLKGERLKAAIFASTAMPLVLLTTSPVRRVATRAIDAVCDL